MRHAIAVLLSLAAALLLSSCITPPEPEEIPQSLTPMEYFQKAQEAVAARNDYQTAMVYYTTFKDRYPDDLQGNVEADYEIAFLNYKMENYDLAKEQLQAVIDRYDTDEAARLREWPLVLSRKVLAKIEAMESTGVIPAGEG